MFDGFSCLSQVVAATALVVVGADLTAFVAYDQRLLDAARRHGLPTESPGAAGEG